jgi:sugar phosphate isomerase/epimerase
LKLVQINGANQIPPGKPDWKQLIQPLGTGDFDVRPVLRLLDEVGYLGPFNLQCYQIQQPARQHLSQSMKAWRTFNRRQPSN